MASVRADLLSIQTVLDDLTVRVTAIGEQHTGTERDDISAALFDAERLLRQASRRIGRVAGEVQ